MKKALQKPPVYKILLFGLLKYWKILLRLFWAMNIGRSHLTTRSISDFGQKPAKTSKFLVNSPNRDPQGASNEIFVE